MKRKKQQLTSLLALLPASRHDALSEEEFAIEDNSVKVKGHGGESVHQFSFHQICNGLKELQFGFETCFSPYIKATASGESTMLVFCGSPLYDEFDYFTSINGRVGLLNSIAQSLLRATNVDSKTQGCLTLSWYKIDCGENEGITDLLRLSSPLSVGKCSDPNLVLRELGKGRGMIIPGLWEVELTKPSDADAVINHVLQTLSYAKHDGTSHSIFQMTISPNSVNGKMYQNSHLPGSRAAVSEDPVGLGRLTIVLLANSGPNLIEGINDLYSSKYPWYLFLTDVLKWIETKRPSPPFHKSRIILLLRDALCGRMPSLISLFMKPAVSTQLEDESWLSLVSRIYAIANNCKLLTTSISNNTIETNLEMALASPSMQSLVPADIAYGNFSQPNTTMMKVSTDSVEIKHMLASENKSSGFSQPGATMTKLSSDSAATKQIFLSENRPKSKSKKKKKPNDIIDHETGEYTESAEHPREKSLDISRIYDSLDYSENDQSSIKQDEPTEDHSISNPTMMQTQGYATKFNDSKQFDDSISTGISLSQSAMRRAAVPTRGYQSSMPFKSEIVPGVPTLSNQSSNFARGDVLDNDGIKTLLDTLEVARTEISSLKKALNASQESTLYYKIEYERILSIYNQEGSALRARDKSKLLKSLQELRDYDVYREVMEAAMSRMQGEIDKQEKENGTQKQQLSLIEKEFRKSKVAQQKLYKEIDVLSKQKADLIRRVEVLNEEMQRLHKEKEDAEILANQAKVEKSKTSGELSTTIQLKESEITNLKKRLNEAEMKVKMMNSEQNTTKNLYEKEIESLRNAQKQNLLIIGNYQEENELLRSAMADLMENNEKTNSTLLTSTIVDSQ